MALEFRFKIENAPELPFYASVEVWTTFDQADMARVLREPGSISSIPTPELIAEAYLVRRPVGYEVHVQKRFASYGEPPAKIIERLEDFMKWAMLEVSEREWLTIWRL